jgi:hypothetical protein
MFDRAAILLAPWLFATTALATDDPTRISEAKLRKHVGLLASEAYGGRGTSEWGGWLTQWHVARSFEEVGLEQLPGEDDWFVDFTLYQQGIDAAATRLSIGGKEYLPGEDFRPFAFSGTGKAEGEVVFAGYGIRSEEHEWDDYANLDVEGKFVFVLRHEPGEKDPNSSFDGTSSTGHASFTTKARVAQEAGAIGMLLVTDPMNHDDADDLRLGGGYRLAPPAEREADEEPDPFLAVQVTRDVAAILLGSDGPSLLALQEAIEAGKAPAELAPKLSPARLSVVRPERALRIPDRNVAGFLRGSDPKLADEWVVIGGHHDHLGSFEGEGDTVFNGADDNASGTAGVLELARSFAQAPSRPRRSIAFFTFAAEEQGLLGSRAMVEQGLIPVEKVVYMFNLDMIGRNEDKPLEAYGDGYAVGLREIIEAANAEVGLEFDFGGSKYMGRSDHDPFYKEDVPFSFFFTGTHEDYHQLSDHYEKIDFERAVKIVQVARGVVERIANADRAPNFIHHVDWIGASVQIETVAGSDAAVVTAVEEGSRGAEAGLQPGDVVRGFGGTPLESPKAVGAGFRGIEPGTSAKIMLAREGRSLEIEVERAKPGYIGLWPAAVDEDERKRLGLPDNEGFLVRQAVAEGPAAQGGLQTDDIVLTLNGQPVRTNNLRALLSRIGAGEEVAVGLIRDGERRSLTVTLGERQRRQR